MQGITTFPDNLVAVVQIGQNFVYVPYVDIERAASSTFVDKIVLDRALAHPGEVLYVKGRRTTLVTYLFT